MDSKLAMKLERKSDRGGSTVVAAVAETRWSLRAESRYIGVARIPPLRASRLRRLYGRDDTSMFAAGAPKLWDPPAGPSQRNWLAPRSGWQCL